MPPSHCFSCMLIVIILIIVLITWKGFFVCLTVAFSLFRMKGLEVEVVNGKEDSSLSVRGIMLHLSI